MLNDKCRLVATGTEEEGMTYTPLEIMINSFRFVETDVKSKGFTVRLFGTVHYISQLGVCVCGCVFFFLVALKLK